MVYQKTSKNISKSPYKKYKGVWKGKTKQNYTYPNKNQKTWIPPSSGYDPKLDRVWEWDPLTKETQWYSQKDFKKVEEERMREWTKKYKQNKLGIWLEK